jgi:hypothetical protein
MTSMTNAPKNNKESTFASHWAKRTLHQQCKKPWLMQKSFSSRAIWFTSSTAFYCRCSFLLLKKWIAPLVVMGFFLWSFFEFYNENIIELHSVFQIVIHALLSWSSQHFLEVSDKVSMNQKVKVFSLIHGCYINGRHFPFITLNLLHHHYTTK